MENQIIKTLSYFDIFDYPLTFAEIKKYLECEIEYSDDELYDIIDSISVIQEANGYYYLLGRRQITEKRAERAHDSIKKIAKAQVLSKFLSVIPSIEYIGISGSLSMSNASEEDDIDLFFVTKKNTLWISRLAVSLLLQFIGQKRKRNSKQVKDKICPNMFMSISALGFSPKKRNLYIAHEIVQLKTLYDRNDTYSCLLAKNRWVSNFFPNFYYPSPKKRKIGIFENVILSAIKPFEKIAYYFQLAYMISKKSGETITNTKAFFHPVDRQGMIMDMLELRFDRYKRLYDDNMWVDTDEARFYMEEKKIRILN